MGDILKVIFFVLLHHVVYDGLLPTLFTDIFSELSSGRAFIVEKSLFLTKGSVVWLSVDYHQSL